MKKVKKFGRGGDILTGLGAGLLGYAAYKELTKGKGDKKDTSSKEEESPTYDRKKLISEEVDKAQSSSRKEKPREEYVAADAEENKAKKDALSGGMKYKKPEGPAAQDVSGIKKKSSDSSSSGNASSKSNVILPATDTYAGATKPSAAHAAEVRKIFKGVNDPNKGKYKKSPAPADTGKVTSSSYIDKSGIIYDERGDPVRKADSSPSMSDPQGSNRVREISNKDPSREYLRKLAEKGREEERRKLAEKQGYGIKKGGMVKKYASGGSVKASKMGSVKTAKPTMRSASARADGIAIRGKTRA